MRTLFTTRWLVSHTFVLTMVVVMIGLGFWQLDRRVERNVANDEIAAAAERVPVEIESILDGLEPVVEHRRVIVRGQYLDESSFLVANRSFETQAGSWLATPVELDDGTVVVVARGWVPRLWVAGSDPRTVATPSDVELVGRVFVSVDGGLIGSGTDGYAEVSRMELSVVEEAISLDVADVWIQLEAQLPAVLDLPIPVPPPPLGEGPHLSYAFQWFFFSSGAIVVYGLILRRKLRDTATMDGDR
ncbi:MAG: SURF1 family protein [Acidimicrobiaceae bacterium]|jgi:surfeit locus 1 family protein|nr:SURF1 family protein [Acidimicrobiaceae bacterium]MBT5580358.1 SURF1 family protein [Acidimicrobiaceae bacterium]MBT5850600.1 SURF1 family protein [Acidimicrobiaceae bacterium]